MEPVNYPIERLIMGCDLKYIEKVSFLSDVKILLQTVAVLFKRSGITDSKNATALD